ncbi:MAG: DUF1775 domain-containing protein [Acidobacteria bacterium]|nr:DUF1775 domain-containing protein [Acidobacteriota bacterium]
MRPTACVLTLVLALPSIAAAHIGIRPRESRPAAEERYTVRVPTEGAIATSSVRLEIPDGVTVLEVERVDGATFESQKKGERIIGITWKMTIEPKASAEFVFRARNPSSGAEIAWKAHQHFADGTVTDWIGPAGDKRPAPVTKLTAEAMTVVAQAPSSNDATAIETWLKGYDGAFNAKDLDRLAAFYHPDVTIYEGGGINNGWVDYRDRHLGPELKAFQNLEFAHRETKVTMLGPAAAYATSRYTLKAKMGDRDIDSEGERSDIRIRLVGPCEDRRHSKTRPRELAGAVGLGGGTLLPRLANACVERVSLVDCNH